MMPPDRVGIFLTRLDQFIAKDGVNEELEAFKIVCGVECEDFSYLFYCWSLLTLQVHTMPMKHRLLFVMLKTR